MKKLFLLIGLILMLNACQKKGPQPINFGQDACDYCRMNIVQPQYGAELITTKGKVYKFDAVECMINYKTENQEMEFRDHYVINFAEAQKLIQAQSAFYLHSRNLPSPMGMFLTATGQKQKAEELKRQHGGKIYSWQELNDNFKRLPDLVSTYKYD
jgi:copper chaperone NosL